MKLNFSDALHIESLTMFVLPQEAPSKKEKKENKATLLVYVVSCATMTFADVALVTEREGDAYIPT